MTTDLQLSDRRRLLFEALLQKQGVQTAPQPQIPRRSEKGPARLSFGQQRLWFLHQLDPGALTFNLSEGVRLSGPLDVAALRRAFAELLRRHEALRTLFATIDGEPVQVVAAAPELPLACADLEGLPAEARLDEATRLGSWLVARPFELTRALPLRGALLRLAEEDHALVLAMHHIASDAWSMGILVQELTTLYGAFAAGSPSPLSGLPIQYTDFAAWQRDRLQGETLDTLLHYWRERLAGAPASLSLPADRPRPARQSSRGGSVRMALDPESTTALRALALDRGSSLFMLLMTAFGVLLQRTTGEDDLLVGTPVAGRNRWELEGLIGFFVNMLALRLDLSGDPRLPDLLERVRETVLGAEAHQELPFEALVKELDVPRDLAQTPLFQVVLAFQSLSAARPASPGGALAPFGMETRAAQYDLHLLVTELPQRISGSLIYRSDLFEEPSAARLARSFETLLRGIAGRRDLPISALPLLAEAERQQLITGWNRFDVRFPHEAPLDRLFAAAAHRTPQAEALSCAGIRWSYAELAARANRLARWLRRLGAGPEGRVGLCLERSPEMIAAILATLQAGAAYVPLDPDLPRERLGFLLADSGVSILLTHSDLAARLPETPGLTRLLLDTERESLEAESSAPLPEATADLDRAAYVIYTSGSTGRPKGVVVTHGNVARLLAATRDWFAFGPADVWTLFHSYAFDFSIWEIWGALAWGGRLVIVPWGVSRSPADFLDLLESERVTVLNQTPSAFRLLAAADAEHPRRLALRTIVFGGEALDPAALASWFDRHGDREPLLVNMYGITETTVHVTYRPMTRADLGAGSRIGVPIPDLQVHVLDRRCEPVPLLAPGEIHVGGAGVARGYLHRPELTAERFVADPFSPEPGARLYRSGDLARRRPDGELEYLGRIDHQVKIRGFRIELGEIQAALTAHPAVREAVALARGRNGDGDRLVAWFVSRNDRVPLVSELRAHLEQLLPSYMVPAAFVQLDRLPVTPNGKLDRSALPDPDPASTHAAAGYVAPETPAEMILARVWSEVLSVQRVGALDNFFALGGDSILSIRVLARARDLGLPMTLQQIFLHQTLGELARALSDGEQVPGDLVRMEPFDLVSEADRRLLPDGVEDAYPLARTQAGMLFHSQLDPGTAVYHDILSDRLRGPFDEEALHRSLARIVTRHAVLRTAFELRETSEPLQLVHREVAAPLEVEDLRGLSEPERERAVDAWLEAERHRGFDWSHPPLLRFHVHRLADDVFQYSLSFHHSVLDGWSAASLRTELFRHYMAMAGGRELPEEPPPAAAFRDSVRLEREALASAETRAFWQQLLADAPPNRLPRWPHERPSAPRAHDHFVQVGPEGTAALRGAARQANVPLKSLLFAAHLAVIARICGEPDVVTGLLFHVRPEQEGGAEALGLFLNIVPARLRLGGETWAELARAAFGLERDMLAHHRLPLGEIQSAAGSQEMFETVFGFTQFHVYREIVQENGGLQSLSSYGYEETNFPLGAHCGLDVEGSWISLRLNSSDAEVAPEQIRAIGACYAHALADLADHLERPHREVSLLSEEERSQVLDIWSDGGPAAPRVNTARLFEERARATPEATAVVGDEASLTYGELDRRANQVARALRMWGVGHDVPVAVCLERSPSMLVGLLAIWKAGGAYVPLDPAYPLERLLFILEDSQAAVLLAEARLLDHLPARARQLPMLRLDSDGRLIDTQEDSPLPDGADAESSAYLIYTSGSTGVPKGVQVPHGGLGNLAAAQTALCDVCPADRVLQFASLSFDASVWEILMALLHGAELHLSAPARLMPGPDLVELLAERRITHLTLPPSVLAVLPEAELPDLRVLVVAGEACPSELARRWSGGPSGRRVVDAYGPTEATVCATAGVVSASAADGGKPLIGRPIAGARVLVLDSWNQPAPTAVPWEIHLGGTSLARGYWRRPDLTAERFVPDPFATTPGARLYRTGDVGRWLPGGELDFIGRADQQLKIRGVRIEPGEIERTLRLHSQVREAVARAYETGADRRLAAWVVPVDRDEEASGSLAADLQSFLRARLPEPMVPSAIVLLDALPLTPNGKLDAAALPAPDVDRLDLLRPRIVPRTPTEELLARIWAEALQLERVSVEDEFLAVGGHSLLAIQIVSRIRNAFGVDLPLRALYEAGTVARLAERVAAARAEAAPETPAIPAGLSDPHEPSPLSETQAAFWMGGTGLYDLGGSSANVYVEYEASGSAGELAGRLNLVLARTVARHPMLRTVVSADGMQRVLAETPRYEVELLDLSRLSDGEAERHLESARERLRYSRHPTDRWPLFDLVVHQLPGEQIRIQARFDSVLVDGTSRNLLIDELVRGVLQEEEGVGRSDPPLEVTYFDYVRALRAFRDSATWQRCRDYWLARLPSLPPAPRLPMERDFGPETVPRIAWRRVTVLDPDPWAALCRRAAQRGLTPNGIGTALLAETLRAWSDEPSFTLGLAGAYHPPVHPQIRQVVGTFTALHLLVVEEDAGSFAERARRLQDRLNTDLDHQHFSGHEALRELNRARRSGGRATLPIHFTSILRSGTSAEEAAEPDEQPAVPAGQPRGAAGLRQIDLMAAIPQVLLLWVLGESTEKSLFLISQAVDELFPPGLVTDLIDSYCRLARRLAEDEAAWSEPRPLRLPVPVEPEAPAPVTAASELGRLAGLGPDDRLLVLSPPGSGLALCEAEAARTAGATLIRPAADERTPEALAALAERERITVWSSTPAVFEAALHQIEKDGRRALRTLRRVLLHRDRVPAGLPARLDALGTDVQAFATWGAAGAPIAASGPLGAEAEGNGLPLQAAAGRRLHVLDRDLTPRPAWVPGDLYLGGGTEAEPLEATGERARRLPDGRIEILGNEPPPPVEALGYGADPRRIEAALQRHPAVRHAVVAWREPERRLAAWLLPRTDPGPSDRELHDHLRAHLPEHLVPAVFVRLEEFPLTPDGRVDRSALTMPPEPPPPADAAWSALATELAGLWEDVVGQRPAALDDDFFELGGNSLLAVRLLGRIAGRYGLEKPLARFLDRPTLACLTRLVEQERAESERRAPQSETEERSPLRRLRDRLAAFRARLVPPPTSPAYGMRLYLILWFSQFVSGVGTGLGSFALGVWVYRQNASATQYSMFAFVATCTGLLVGPLAGVLADRWDRKRLILLGDSGAAVMTCVMALALYTGQMRLWHVYVIVVVMVGFSALQGPALVASISQLVSRRQLGRVGGMTQAAGIATGIICPPLSGALVPLIGYHGVIAIDISTFLFAFFVLLFIRLPRPAPTAAGRQRRSLLGDFRFGWDYLRHRPGLLSLLWVFAATNFAVSIVQVLLTPLILSFGSAANLGFVNAATAAGGLIGSLILSIWGGPRNRVSGILLFLLLQAPILLLGALRPDVMLIAVACCVFAGLNPLIGGLSQAIWQSKVAHDVQGRVFAMRGLIGSSTAPLALLLAGPLADRIFEPLMAPGGALAGTVGQIIGIGKGRGVGLLFVTLGLFIMLVVVLFSLNPRLRRVETELPDATAAPETPLGA